MDNQAALTALAALAQGTRLETFRLLVKHEPQGLPAGDIARELGIPQNTMSSHLAVLVRAGLAHAERRSRTMTYRAELPTLRELTLFLVKDCCGAHPDLCLPLLANLQPCCPEPKAIA